MPALSRTQRQVFTAAYACPGLSLGELARATGLACGTVSRAVYRLERAGLLTSLTRRARVGVRGRHTRVCRLVRPAAWTVSG